MCRFFLSRIFMLALYLSVCNTYAQVFEVKYPYGGAKYQPVEFWYTDTAKVFHEDAMYIANPLPDTVPESAINNPWTDVVMYVSISKNGFEYRSTGYFAADGYASHTCSDSGSVWKARIIPPDTGEYDYSITVHYGAGINLEYNQDDQYYKWLKSYSSSGKIYCKDSLVSNPSRFDRHGPIYYSNRRYPIFCDGTVMEPIVSSSSAVNQLALPDFGSSSSTDGVMDWKLPSFPSHISDTLLYPDTIPSWCVNKGIFGYACRLQDFNINGMSISLNNMNSIDGDNVFPWIYRSNILDGGTDISQYSFSVKKLERWQDYMDYLRQVGDGFVVDFQLWGNGNDLKYTGDTRMLYMNVLGASIYNWYPASYINLGTELNWPNNLPSFLDTLVKYSFVAYSSSPYSGYKDAMVGFSTIPDSIVRDTMYKSIQQAFFWSGASLNLETYYNSYIEVNKWADFSEKNTHNWMISCDDHIGAYIPIDSLYPTLFKDISPSQLDRLISWFWEPQFSGSWRSSFDSYGYNLYIVDNLFNSSKYVESFWDSTDFDLNNSTYRPDLTSKDYHHVRKQTYDSVYVYLNSSYPAEDFSISLDNGSVYTVESMDIVSGEFLYSSFLVCNEGASDFSSIPNELEKPCVSILRKVECGCSNGKDIYFHSLKGKSTDSGNIIYFQVFNQVGVDKYEVYRKDGTLVFEFNDISSTSFEVVDESYNIPGKYYVIAYTEYGDIFSSGPIEVFPDVQGKKPNFFPSDILGRSIKKM